MKRNKSWLATRWNGWVALGAVGIALVLCLLWAGVVWLTLPRGGQAPTATAELVVIAAPTATATLSPEEMPTATPTPPVTIDGIGVGVYVQITGTDGDGLRLRSGPGTDQPPVFLGMDAELFQVQDGPKMADGFTWWYLVAPYDQNRKGWAASKYLAVVPQPSE